MYADSCYDYFLAVQREAVEYNFGSHNNVDVHVPGYKRHVHRNDVSLALNMF